MTARDARAELKALVQAWEEKAAAKAPAPRSARVSAALYRCAADLAGTTAYTSGGVSTQPQPHRTLFFARGVLIGLAVVPTALYAGFPFWIALMVAVELSALDALPRWYR